MRLLVQNLTRLGDLLQSQPALAELASEGHEIALVGLENFAGAAQLLPGVSRIFPLPGAGLLAGLDSDWREALVGLTDFADRIGREFVPEAVVNLTSSVAARLLAKRFCGGAVRGFSLDALGFRLETTPWAVFLEASSANRGLSPFNIVDLFRKAAGVGRGQGRFSLVRPGAAALAAARARLEGQVPGATAYVGLQLGASAATRQWPVAAFARLGDWLWQSRRIAPVLLGGPGETALGAAYGDLAVAPAVNLIGRTSLPELANVLACLNLLVTNDTGTLHLAAGLDLPSVALFFATAQPFDTGPYRPGCLCLEPDMPCHPCPFNVPCPRENACLTAIGPDTVAGAVADFFDTGGFAARTYPGARAWLSAFDPEGFMDLHALSGHDTEARAVWLRLQRRVLRRFLDEEAAEASEKSFGDALPEPLRAALATSLGQSADLLRLLAGQAALLSRSPAMKSRFLATWDRLQRLWSGSPHLAVLGHLWQRQAQDPGCDLPALLAHIDRYAGCVAAFTRLIERA
jgi:ADP-heptose:LPS heptosyltransferase